MFGGCWYSDIKGVYLCHTSALWKEPFPQPTKTSITQLMNHAGLKADNKGPGIVPGTRALVLICSQLPRSHVSLAAWCGCSANLLQSGGGNGNRSCCYLCVLLSELLWALAGAGSPGAPWKPPSQHWQWITGIHTVIVRQIQKRFTYTQMLTKIVLHCGFYQQCPTMLWFTSDVDFALQCSYTHISIWLKLLIIIIGMILFLVTGHTVYLVLSELFFLLILILLFFLSFCFFCEIYSKPVVHLSTLCHKEKLHESPKGFRVDISFLKTAACGKVSANYVHVFLPCPKLKACWDCLCCYANPGSW